MKARPTSTGRKVSLEFESMGEAVSAAPLLKGILPRRTDRRLNREIDRRNRVFYLMGPDRYHSFEDDGGYTGVRVELRAKRIPEVYQGIEHSLGQMAVEVRELYSRPAGQLRSEELDRMMDEELLRNIGQTIRPLVEVGATPEPNV